jgi:NAD(P)-dependent dehydrogenase (short-subunit alcohol dehydrogenase family)
MTDVPGGTAPATPTGPLAGQTVLVLGGSSGIGLETARQASQQGAQVLLAGRDPGRLARAAQAVRPVRTAAFDVTGHAALSEFIGGLDLPLDHVMVTAGGPYYAPLADIDLDQASERSGRMSE